MSLTAYRRHLSACPFQRRGQNYTLCDCPVWCSGLVNGLSYRHSLRTNEWNRALRRIERIESGDRDALLPEARNRTVSSAIKAYLADCGERNLKQSSIASLRRTLGHMERRFGALPVASLTADRLREFQTTRNVKPRTHRKEIEYMRALCAFCVSRGWIETNPAKMLRAPLIATLGTLPFTRKEIAKLLDACDQMRGMWKSDTPAVRKRARALVLTLAYSGLRVGDVAQLRRDALESDDHLVLRTMKTGVRLKVLLHADAARALRSLPAPGGNPAYFFWSGHGDVDDCSKSLWLTVSRVGKVAEIAAHPHRFRDTFAVELLTNGADIRTVQQLLGHASLRTTELHYAHFVAAHQELLDRAAQTLDFTERTGAPLLVNPIRRTRRNAK